jgi:broad specificity phosphatase PhoE
MAIKPQSASVSLPAGDRFLVLLRHAHRDDVGSRSEDCLSELGHRQAEQLAQKIPIEVRRQLELSHTEGGRKEPLPLFYSSPKIRCQQTLGAMIRSYPGSLLQVEPTLDERGGQESWNAFLERIEDFFRIWLLSAAPGSLTLACSHGDWLPEASFLFLKEALSFSRAGWILIRASLVERQEPGSSSVIPGFQVTYQLLHSQLRP